MVEDNKPCLKDTCRDYAREYAKEWANGALDTIPSTVAFSIYDNAEMVSFVKTRYENDKKVYLESGKWPKGIFYRRDDMWNYYYFLQLTDTSINLEKYLDFDYDTNKYSRDRLISIVFHYGIRALFLFRLYVASGMDMSFGEYACKKYKEDFESVERRKKALEYLDGQVSLKKHL